MALTCMMLAVVFSSKLHWTTDPDRTEALPLNVDMMSIVSILSWFTEALLTHTCTLGMGEMRVTECGKFLLST